MHCFETIRIQDGIPQHLHYHDLRLNHTRKALFGIDQEITLAEHLTQLPPKGLYRAKVIYDAECISVHYYRYRPKTITTLYLTEADIDYSHKYLDRTPLTKLLTPHSSPLTPTSYLLTPTSYLLPPTSSLPTLHSSLSTLHSSLFTIHYSDILITQNGLLTDTSIANIALRQQGIWYTPARPLLAGTTRARLLEQGELQLRDIHRDTLDRYDGFALMNAMIGFSIVNPEFLTPYSSFPIQGKPCP